MAGNIACESLVAQLRVASAAAEKALKAPKQLAALADKMMAYPLDKAQELLNTALSSMGGLNFDLGLQELTASLENMLNCPFIADSALGRSIASALDVIDETGQLPNDIINELKSQISSSAKEALSAATKTPAGAVSTAMSSYNDVLKRYGVTSAINDLKKLADCVAQLCADYDNLPETADSIMSKARAKIDSAGNAVTNVIDTAESLPEQSKAAFNNFTTAMSNAKAKAESIVINIVPSSGSNP